MATDAHPRLWLITSPRTASNLFIRILNLDEQGVRPTPSGHGGYFFMPAAPIKFSLHNKPLASWTDEERTKVDKSQRECFNSLQGYLEAAEAEKQRVFVKEHAVFMNDPYFESRYGHGPHSTRGTALPPPIPASGGGPSTRSVFNMTAMPDEFLKTWRPTFLIRHPALMVPSFYRTILSDLEVEGWKRETQDPSAVEKSTIWIRYMYQFFDEHCRSHGTSAPIVLDADDIMRQPQIVVKYAEMVGLDPTKLKFSWDVAPQEQVDQMPAFMQRMMSSLIASNKVDSSKAAGSIDVDAEAAKWKAEFGVERGCMVEEWVKDCMPDYEYLRSKRLTMEG